MDKTLKPKGQTSLSIGQPKDKKLKPKRTTEGQKIVTQRIKTFPIVCLIHVSYRKSISPTLMSLLGLPKGDNKLGVKGVGKDEMAPNLTPAAAKVIYL